MQTAVEGHLPVFFILFSEVCADSKSFVWNKIGFYKWRYYYWRCNATTSFTRKKNEAEEAQSKVAFIFLALVLKRFVDVISH